MDDGSTSIMNAALGNGCSWQALHTHTQQAVLAVFEGMDTLRSILVGAYL